jgi:hypothetical protein
MNAQFQFIRQRARSRGITLIECLVYIGALATVFGMGTAAFYHSSASSAALRRNADDIAQVLHVGERWRADVRAATQPVRFEAAEQTLHLTQRETVVVYKFADHQILRRARTGSPWVVLLPRVAQSQMAPESRAHVTGWRWELELKSLREPAPLRPLFTFTAVPGPL